MTLAPDPDSVYVRMYNVGFGDGFLIVFPAPDRPRRVLVDCGTHFKGKGPRPIAEVAAQMIEDVTDDDGVARIDVVVGTHRHQDHVSGFENKLWQDVEVSEVWMPWTEDPKDPDARRIRERQSALALELTSALAAAGDDSIAYLLAMNALTNEKAMATLHGGFKGSPPRSFLPATKDDVVEEVVCPVLNDAGIEVNVLGPSHDEAVIKNMDPPNGAGYLRVAEHDQADVPEPPFDASWAFTSRAVRSKRLEPFLLRDGAKRLVVAAAQADPFGVAASLESAVNNTSLVMTFKLGDAFLVFPGDAQWGTWKRILDAPEARELLRQTSFVKVGHHGSHNASPKAFVELLAAEHADDGDHEDLWAMVSTRLMKDWPQIPKKELMTALGHATPQLARSDKGKGKRVAGFESWSELFIDAKVPVRAP
jgi:beta-lactamase superfamily II metal-dependent hydrolase